MAAEASNSKETAGQPWPWVTVSCNLACIVVYIGLATTSDKEWQDVISRWGYVSAPGIWGGAYWGLLSSCFVHASFLHLAFNVYWWWVLGGRFELQFGSTRYLLFLVLAGFVSSAAQLGISGDTGIGASGIGYALFGFAVLLRHRVQVFGEVLSKGMVVLWLAWLVGCIIVTHLDIYPIGNAAHVSGMVFGGFVALCFVRKIKLVAIPLVAMVIVSVIALFWVPWSTNWLAYQAPRAHQQHDYDAAIKYYSSLLEREPDAAWAWWNRGCAYYELEQFEEAEADFDEARRLDPSMGISGP